MELKMSERPLAIDVSKWQSEPFNLRELLGQWDGTENEVHLVYVRAGVGVKFDPYFLENYQDAKDAGKYVTSYWAIDPEQDWQVQLDKWLEAHPKLDGVPRVIDAELHGSLTPQAFATFIKWFSDNILAHDGVRPWIYAGYYTFRDYILYYNKQEWIDDHYYIVAHYGDGDADEDDDVGIVLPPKMPIDRLIYKQTTSKAYMPGYTINPIDRNRFLLGLIEDVHDFMSQYFPEPPVEEDDPLYAKVVKLEGIVADLASTVQALIASHNKAIEFANNNLSYIEEHDAKFIEMMDGIRMVDEAVASRFNDLEEQFKTHSLRQKVWKAVIEGRVLACEKATGLVGPWWKRLFRRSSDEYVEPNQT